MIDGKTWNEMSPREKRAWLINPMNPINRIRDLAEELMNIISSEGSEILSAIYTEDLAILLVGISDVMATHDKYDGLLHLEYDEQELAENLHFLAALALDNKFEKQTEAKQ